MRIKQDLSIAIVLAVIGSGMASPGIARDGRSAALSQLELAMENERLSAEEIGRIRARIAEASRLAGRGDDDGAASAMAAALAILGAG